MYRHFTERARRAVALARQRARRLDHPYLGTEHLLLGLVDEGAGVAATLLKELGVDPPAAEREVLALVRPGSERVGFGRLPLTPRAKQVIDGAVGEAAALRHSHVRTEHLLLALMRVREGVAAHALDRLGVDADLVREEVLSQFGVDAEPACPPSVPAWPTMGVATREVFRRATLSASAEGAWHVQPEHLLLAIAEGDSRAAKMLHDAGLTSEHIERLLQAQGRPLSVLRMK